MYRAKNSKKKKKNLRIRVSISSKQRGRENIGEKKGDAKFFSSKMEGTRMLLLVFATIAFNKPGLVMDQRHSSILARASAQKAYKEIEQKSSWHESSCRSIRKRFAHAFDRGTRTSSKHGGFSRSDGGKEGERKLFLSIVVWAGTRKRSVCERWITVY